MRGHEAQVNAPDLRATLDFQWVSLRGVVDTGVKGLQITLV